MNTRTHEGRMYKELGLEIRKYRRLMGISQDALGKEVGLSRTALVNIEKGKQGVLVWTLVRICRALCVSPSCLLGTEP